MQIGMTIVMDIKIIIENTINNKRITGTHGVAEIWLLWG
jgi:hypothetical protein